MEQLLTSFGVNIASAAFYDFLKSIFQTGNNCDEDILKTKLVSFLKIQNAGIIAEEIITFLAKNGDIEIQGSTIFAKSIALLSDKGTRLTFGNESVSETPKTRIEAGKGAFIEATGGAGIKQNEDGTIQFFA